ncbi:hypothetical protein BT69DRAFT_1335559 [Atractiella rhizophila]|nr:hypothetical protein BT69DRAFT_1335559 [Atractiella rhizophila]
MSLAEAMEYESRPHLQQYLIAERSSDNPEWAPGTRRFLAGAPQRISPRSDIAPPRDEVLKSFAPLLDETSKRTVAQLAPFNQSLKSLSKYGGIPEPAPLPALMQHPTVLAKEANSFLDAAIKKNKWRQAGIEWHDVTKVLDQAKENILSSRSPPPSLKSKEYIDSTPFTSIQRVSERFDVPISNTDAFVQLLESRIASLAHEGSRSKSGSQNDRRLLASIDERFLRSIDNPDALHFINTDPISHFDGSSQRIAVLKKAVEEWPYWQETLDKVRKRAMERTESANKARLDRMRMRMRIDLDSVQRKRRRKMNKQKYKKRRREQKFLRKKQGK